MTSVWSGMIALVLTAVIGWFLVPALRALKAGQSIKEIGPSWHMSKQGTPTMGGLMFILGILVAIVLIGWPDIARGDFRAVFVFCFALVFGVIGYLDDYEKVKKHENTREDKEIDRIRHVDTVNAQTGPIFLAYRQNETLKAIVAEEKAKPALYDFVSDDGIRHRVWKINDPAQTEAIEAAFAAIPATYIADGHHRAASAVKVGLKRRAENPGYTGEEPFNYFLSVLFPDEELMILPYNRVVKDLNGLSREQFFEAVKEKFELEEIGKEPYAPAEKGTFGMYLDNTWYALKVLPQYKSADPVKGLDVSILQDQLLGPVLGIGDPRTDKRIDFIGGIRGLKELERRVSEDMEIAFSMYPTSIEELLAVADAGLLMPPKSTWFEPKLRSGLFIHRLS